MIIDPAADSQRPAFELKGRHVLLAMLVFFGLIIAVNTVFITLAVRTFPGEDVKRSYIQGLNYNATLVERAHARALGWDATAAFEGDRLVIRLTDRDGRPLDGAVIEAVLRRPAETRSDRALDFTPLGGGGYAAHTPGLERGGWRLRAVVLRGTDRFEAEARLEWR